MNSKTLTRKLEHVFAEMCDGFAFVGFIAGKGDVVIITSARDEKTQLGLNALLDNIAAEGGVSLDGKPKS